MVCSFCVQGVEKKVGSISGVDAVKVDLKAKVVTLTTEAPDQITDESIREAILAAGYNVERIVRPNVPPKSPSAAKPIGTLEVEKAMPRANMKQNSKQEPQP